eukprot:TRINITY_DN10229_c0_g1_i1.p2 TRINITY_DN10229_c0_g1~~TRINITY_DN10229_c0_g1_i1.p2  ORF type:complete len:376 (+),score=65.50 TRINITY_DN10229_c0_g1_i1:2425-3552(+)
MLRNMPSYNVMLTFLGHYGCALTVFSVCFEWRCCVLMLVVSVAQFNAIVEQVRVEAPLGFDRKRASLLKRIAVDADLPLRTVQAICSSWLRESNTARERKLSRDERNRPHELYTQLNEVDDNAIDIFCRIAEHCQRQPYHVIKAILVKRQLDATTAHLSKAQLKGLTDNVKRALRSLEQCEEFLDTLELSEPEAKRLHDQIRFALKQDAANGPYHARLTHSLGDEYEYHLAELLRLDRVVFLSENTARVLGNAITPDIQFVTPIILQNLSVVWIDSKASFGDPVSMVASLSGQFGKYVRAHGSGAVIYWFGIVSHVPRELVEEHGLIVPEHCESDKGVDVVELYRHHRVALYTDYPSPTEMLVATAHHKTSVALP